jgi:hypothetical protein
MAALIGCDFSSRPTRRKPIVLAHGRRIASRVLLDRLQSIDTLDAFAGWLAEPGDWLGGFDLPFGLPRELVRSLGWPLEWEACMRHYAALGRAQIRDRFKAFCDARPVGAKFAHRATDLPAGSSPSMKWVNPPVAYMLHAGMPLLLDAGVYLPGLQSVPSHGPGLRRPDRVALEAYPGLLAREVLGRGSYKSDDRAKQTPVRLHRRTELVHALQQGDTTLGLHLELNDAQRGVLVSDPSGDSLDAVLCLMQVAWASRQGWPLFGLPADLDPLEGWIVTAGAALDAPG